MQTDGTETTERPDYWDGYHQAMLGHPLKVEGGKEYRRGHARGTATFNRMLEKWLITPQDLPPYGHGLHMTTETAALASFSDDDLKAELSLRSARREGAYWERRKAEAKYLCHACGMPDSYHTHDCPSDTDCT